MKKFIKIILILSPLLCFIVIWGVSLAKCEINTLIHGDKFSELYEEILGEQDYWKILDYSGKSARVYYVSLNKETAGNYTVSMGNILKFIQIDGEWVYEKWEETVWSTAGNADNVVWPYWWHFFYSH